MTSAEANKGIRRFLRGHGGDEITFQWLEQSGEAGRAVLFHLLRLPSTSKKLKATIVYLLVNFFFSPETEAQLLDFVRSRPDSRLQQQGEFFLRALIAERETTRASLLASTKHFSPHS